MKIPHRIEEVSVFERDLPKGPYPSLGFVPVYEAELGNGDHFGLYWPLGKEESEPLICDMFHDEGKLEASFSSLEKFIEWLELNDWERGEQEVIDEELSSFLLNKAKKLYSSSDIEPAIELLKKACLNLPEVSEYWFALSSQLKRVGEIEESGKIALKALNSNWAFGFPAQGVLRSLKTAQYREILKDDPIVQRIEELSLSFGGLKENRTYPVIYECVQEYLKNEKYLQALMLYQNYAYMMSSETISFQERYSFSLDEWQKQFSELCLKHLCDNRQYNKI